MQNTEAKLHCPRCPYATDDKRQVLKHFVQDHWDVIQDRLAYVHDNWDELKFDDYLLRAGEIAEQSGFSVWKVFQVPGPQAPVPAMPHWTTLTMDDKVDRLFNAVVSIAFELGVLPSAILQPTEPQVGEEQQSAG